VDVLRCAIRVTLLDITSEHVEEQKVVEWRPRRPAIDCGCDLRNKLAYLATKIKYGCRRENRPVAQPGRAAAFGAVGRGFTAYAPA
jgi:hypothetical protein